MALRRRISIAVLALASLVLQHASAAEIKVLSAGAIEPGLRAAVAAYEKSSSDTVKITFNTAPQLRKRVEAGEAWDVVIAPPAVLDDFAKQGRIAGDRASVGRVGLGVAVRADAPVPAIDSEEALRRSILEADSLVFNRASTGLYLEQLLRKLRIYDDVERRTTRYDDGASVMEHVLKGRGREIGFGAITEILLYREKGLRFVGPLPASLQNYTSYAAATTQAGDGPARALVQHLGGPAGRALFVAAGIQ